MVSQSLLDTAESSPASIPISIWAWTRILPVRFHEQPASSSWADSMGVTRLGQRQSQSESQP